MVNQVQSKLGDRAHILPADPEAQRFIQPFCRKLYQTIEKKNGQWSTNNEYPLSPCLLHERWLVKDSIIGVRFDKETEYLMIDIDRHSIYHPFNDEKGVDMILGRMEAMGLVRSIMMRSSTSMGLHIYLPLPEAVNTFKLACAVHAVLADLRIAKGQLEIFPNCKSFVEEGFSEYNGHRLPLQEGSYILDREYQPISQDIKLWNSMWQTVAEAQDMRQLHKALSKAKKPKSSSQSEVRGSAAKYKRDLETEIEKGWEPHRTQAMLPIIAKRIYIFDGIGDEQELGMAIATTARATKGFDEFSRHTHEIEKISRKWARWIIGSEKYRPYGSGNGIAAPKETETKLARLEQVRQSLITFITEIGDRYFRGVKELLTYLSNQLKSSFSTLYKLKDLWQPLLNHCNASPSQYSNDLETPESLDTENSGLAETITESRVTVEAPNVLFLSEFSEKKSQAQAPIPYSEVSKFSNENLEPIQDIVYTEIMSFEQQIAIANICPTSRSPQPQNFRLPKEPLRQNPSTLENIRAAVEANPSCAGMRLAMLQAKLCLPALTATERSQTEDAIAWLESLKPS